eukprot:c855_g1_i1.p1 GENE.c855_g1_i1~~c855_g1_i1.p1  ORF type:complete len:261 (-),score=58.52 c855_g1_i1:616-1368(-)
MLPSLQSFVSSKRQILAALASDEKDNSKKGGLDEPIKDICNYINSTSHFVTTSSCSGRVSVFSETAGAEKRTGNWLFASHDPITDNGEAILKCVRERDPAVDEVWFKFEPFILHVQCVSLHCAQKLIATSLASGFKNTGMVIGKKILVAVRLTLKLEVPIVVGGDLAVSEVYVRHLVAQANAMFEENKARTARFYANFRELVVELDRGEEVGEARDDKKQRQRGSHSHPETTLDAEDEEDSSEPDMTLFD